MAQQYVSDFMPDSAVSFLIILIATLVLLAWQPVSGSVPGHLLCHFLLSSLSLWSYWLDSM